MSTHQQVNAFQAILSLGGLGRRVQDGAAPGLVGGCDLELGARWERGVDVAVDGEVQPDVQPAKHVEDGDKSRIGRASCRERVCLLV